MELSWERISGWLKEDRHLEHREDGRGRAPAPAPALAPTLVPILAGVLAKEISVLLAVWTALPVSWTSSKWMRESWTSRKQLL